MAVRRGLNKDRGLGSLIPQKKEKTETAEAKLQENTENKEIDKEETADQAENNKAVKVESSASEKNQKNPQKAASGKNMKKAEDSEKTGKEQAEEEKTAKSSSSKSEKKPARTRTTKTAKTTVKKENAPAKTAESKTAAARTAGNKAEKSVKEEKEAVITVRLSQIVPNQDQPRKIFEEAAIDELAESIRQFGVLQPLLVRKKGRYYEIIAGERRWRAAKKAKLKEIPVMVRTFSEQETMEISLIENIQREDLNAIEEAEAYRRLLEEFNLTQEEVAQRVSRSRAAVTNSLRLLKLEAPVREMLVAGKLSMGHARALLALEIPEQQIQTAALVAEKGLSVRETEKLVKKLLNPPAVRTKEEENEQILLAYKSLEESLKKKTGTKVSIKRNGERGKIEIEYYSLDDLERITDLIG